MMGSRSTRSGCLTPREFLLFYTTECGGLSRGGMMSGLRGRVSGVRGVLWERNARGPGAGWGMAFAGLLGEAGTDLS